ncbi:helix-turn-helix domain-containing protein [Legionella maioricensis]|uniref:Helix-turn-helix domain-containing protein n=1 Tax=Legionella maioricensis TaxID=2896528 RepID=A0A9X2IBG6_9GAMM|nr:helix-turn-helix domain-containing protein [Legionella maioricensis]MCL9684904.1 helix-turn-helix domain-containing protein [Legionella maioricensis]MCL9688264.1 helix-turn-helix domain-containing protein [Legionella maioricensis]
MQLLSLSEILNPVLSSLIKSIEIDTKEEQKSIQPYRVMPDFYVVMGFQYSGSLSLLQKSEQIKLARCGISGLQTTYKEFQCSTANTRTLLIKFYPWAIPLLFNESASSFTNQSLNLSDIFGQSLQNMLEERLLSVHTQAEIVPTLEMFFSGLVTNTAKSFDKCFITQMKRIMDLSAPDSVHHLAKDLGYTDRTLERRFKDLVGLSPKKFLLIKRFQNTLMHLRKGMGWEAVMESSNYYDQAHLIHEFKTFSGLTPSKLNN